VHPDATEVGTTNQFKLGATTGDKIDYIFVEPNTEVLSADIVRTAVNGRYPSDHFPVVARIRLR
jgi:endonuclease/exonuclease/phosphatase family metal-dependent hydrolase